MTPRDEGLGKKRRVGRDEGYSVASMLVNCSVNPFDPSVALFSSKIKRKKTTTKEINRIVKTW